MNEVPKTSSEMLQYYLLVFAGLIILFFLMRELMCWYWKINSITKKQDETNSLIARLITEVQKLQKEAIKKVD